jgi:F-type H+-transporting ATPase subunit delta
MLSVVASRYAKALVDVIAAPASGVDPAAALAQLRAIVQLIEGSQDLRNVLLSPAVAPARKRVIVTKILEASVDPALHPSRPIRNFVYVIIDHRRVAEFASIVEAFEAAMDERLGYVRADVLTAQPLGPQQQAGLEAEISRVAGKKAKLKYSIDPALIAGAVARIGSTVYDGSVRGQLDRLRLKLAKG